MQNESVVGCPKCGRNILIVYNTPEDMINAEETAVCKHCGGVANISMSVRAMKNIMKDIQKENGYDGEQ